MHSWPARYHQWWECKFLGEGIIDQGGGFRDSLSDLAEELCPSSSDCPVPLPFFIRTPNQVINLTHFFLYVHRDYLNKKVLVYPRLDIVAMVVKFF